MHKDLILDIEIEVGADQAAVWDALTNPEKIKQYLFGTEAVSAWKEGEAIYFQGEWNGQTYQDKGVINAFVPLKKFQYTYWSSFSGLEDIPENYSELTFDLIKAGSKTKLRLTQQGFASEEAKNHSINNWKMVLEAMRNMLESS